MTQPPENESTAMQAFRPEKEDRNCRIVEHPHVCADVGGGAGRKRPTWPLPDPLADMQPLASEALLFDSRAPPVPGLFRAGVRPGTGVLRALNASRTRNGR